MSEQPTAAWYVAHTYSGYENKVKANLEKTVDNRGMRDVIMDVRVPVEEVVEIKNGKRHTVQRKIYPGYVMVKMVMTDESWYVVRNTRGVTGFVGPGSKPIPLTDEEVALTGVEGEVVRARVLFSQGDHVRVLAGPLENFSGAIEQIFEDTQKLKVVINMFGRDTPVELSFTEVERI